MSMNFLTVYSSYPYKKTRIGKENARGYVICENITYDFLLSAGINDDINFEDLFTKKYCVKCLAFDGTIDKIPDVNNSDITWIKKNIGPTNTEQTTNLKEVINNNKNIFLKMDIESYEFDWIKNITKDELKNISQMTIEFHFPFTNTSLTNIAILDKSVSEKIDCLQKISETHYLVHLYGNNCCGTTTYENITVPNVFQCTYLRKDYFNNIPFKNSKCIPDNILDFPNIQNNNDIILKSYPFCDKKTLIFTMAHDVKNYTSSNIGVAMWGLGDIIKGLIGLYKYSKKNDYHFYIDSQYHILNNFLDISDNPCKEYVKKNCNNINFITHECVDNYIKNNDNNEPIIIYTNMWHDSLENEDKVYIIENFLKPNLILKQCIEKLLANFAHKDDYEIVHCRLNDSEFTSFSNTDKYLQKYNHISKFIKKNTIFLTNSEFFKQYIEDNHKDIFQFKTKTAHIGYKLSNTDYISDTLCEYFIMTKAKKIYTHSDYSWISGFVSSVNNIYDIPIVDIKSL
jgi:hypothetical protein